MRWFMLIQIIIRVKLNKIALLQLTSDCWYWNVTTFRIIKVNPKRQKKCFNTNHGVWCFPSSMIFKLRLTVEIFRAILTFFINLFLYFFAIYQALIKKLEIQQVKLNSYLVHRVYLSWLSKKALHDDPYCIV